MFKFKILAKMYLHTLNGFLNVELSEYGDTQEELGSVLSDMDIYLWVQRRPGNYAVWKSWEIIADELLEKMSLGNEDENTVIKNQFITKEQAFMAGFHMLDMYWENNHDITLGEAVDMVAKCLADIEQNKENTLWDLWVKYLHAEEGKEYNFDYE